MPLIPSYKSWPETPNAGAAYVGGYNASSDAVNAAQALQVRQQAIAADAAQAAARIQLGRESLAQEAVQSKMELQAKQQFVQQRAMQQAQEAEIEHAYRQTEIGMKERQLKNEEAIAGMRLQQAAQGFEASQNFNRIYQAEIAAGKPEVDAQRTAARAVGPEMTGFSSAIRGGASTAERSFEYRQLKDAEDRIFKKYRTRNPENFSPEDQRALSELDRLRRGRFSMQPPSQSGSMSLSSWQVNPSTIPYGAPTTAPQPPKNWSMYMGQQPQFKILGIRQK